MKVVYLCICLFYLSRPKCWIHLIFTHDKNLKWWKAYSDFLMQNLCVLSIIWITYYILAFLVSKSLVKKMKKIRKINENCHIWRSLSNSFELNQWKCFQYKCLILFDKLYSFEGLVFIFSLSYKYYIFFNDIDAKSYTKKMQLQFPKLVL